MLQQDGLPMVEGGVDIPEAINYDAETMYEKLLEEKQQEEKQQEEQKQSNDKQEENNDSPSDGNGDINQSEE